MKAKVIKGFVDKYTDKFHPVGEVIEIDKKRFTEIQKVDNLVKEIVEKPAKKKD